jgi:hypothetical protein
MNFPGHDNLAHAPALKRPNDGGDTRDGEPRESLAKLGEPTRILVSDSHPSNFSTLTKRRLGKQDGKPSTPRDQSDR